jgi:hypothetical protein
MLDLVFGDAEVHSDHGEESDQCDSRYSPIESCFMKGESLLQAIARFTMMTDYSNA